MDKKTILWVIAAVAVVVIGFFIYKVTSKAPAPAVNTGVTAATSTSPQVEAQEVSIGTGAAAAPGMQVSVLYVGQLADGTVFDSSAMHNNAPYTFVLGSSDAGSPIPGFQIGVNGMKEGGERLLAVPPTLGYGSQDVKDASGKVIIPANSTLIFDVQLVKVQAATSTPAKK